VFALLAALAIAVGTVDLHSGSPAEHFAARGITLHGTQIAAGASHPFEAPHVEGSETRSYAPCPTCLLQLQTVSVATPVLVALPVPAGEDAAPGMALAAPRPCYSRFGSPRAPPAAPAG